MDSVTQRTKHEIFLGRKTGETITNPTIAGCALLFEGNNYYVLQLMMFPDRYYFMAKNKDSSAYYTIFSRKVKSDDSVHFQNPVGSARLSEDLKTHLELKFHLFNTNLYMSLFPSE